MADTRTDRHNVLGPASLEEEVVLAQDRIYLVDCGVHMVGGKERRMMRRMVVVRESDSRVVQVENEAVGEVGAAKQRIERLSSEKADCYNHRPLCLSGRKEREQPEICRQAVGVNFLEKIVAAVRREFGHSWTRREAADHGLGVAG